jgi:hypothetical protein
VPLTVTEFAILRVLAEAPRMVFSRDAIIDRVHGPGFAMTDRTIDSHVRNLRAKFEAAGGGDVIETRAGIGYQIGPCVGRSGVIQGAWTVQAMDPVALAGAEAADHPAVGADVRGHPAGARGRLPARLREHPGAPDRVGADRPDGGPVGDGGGAVAGRGPDRRDAGRSG